MNTSELRQSLLDRIASVRQQLQDSTLSNMERDRLYLVWDRAAEDLDDLDHPIIEIPMVDDRVWLGAEEFLAEHEPGTPPPPSPIRFAPSPPPIVLGRDVPLPLQPPVARSVSSHGWPPPPLSFTHLQGRHPLELAEENVLDIARIDHLIESAPHTPRAWEPSEEDVERANAWEDDREGCARCPGCHYCTGYGYDEADEF